MLRAEDLSGGAGCDGKRPGDPVGRSGTDRRPRRQRLLLAARRVASGVRRAARPSSMFASSQEPYADTERLARMRSVMSTPARPPCGDRAHPRPHNASAILRTCDALGVHTVHLLYTDQPSPEISRTVSSSSHQWLDIRRHSDPQTLAVRCTPRASAVCDAKSERSRAGRCRLHRACGSRLRNEHRGCSG
jgi:hypothetical protein